MSEPIEVVVDADLEDLIPGYMANRRRDIVRLRAHLDASEYEEIRVIGHSMRGSGGGYGFDSVTSVGAKIETAAVAQDDDGVRTSIVELEDFLARVKVRFE